jgi:pyruvate dehydrogenase E2 component (dihydrolipoamide acetyltransferase)
MPALSPTMKAGKIAKWNFKIGDKITAGDVLAEIETDKSNVGFEMQDDGYIAQILVPENSMADVGKVRKILMQPVAIIVSKKEEVEQFKGYKSGGEGSSGSKESAPKQPAQEKVF